MLFGYLIFLKISEHWKELLVFIVLQKIEDGHEYDTQNTAWLYGYTISFLNNIGSCTRSEVMLKQT